MQCREGGVSAGSRWGGPWGGGPGPCEPSGFGSSACGAVKGESMLEAAGVVPGVVALGRGSRQQSQEARSPHLISAWPGLCECRVQTSAPSTRTLSSNGDVLRPVWYGGRWPHMALS